MSLASRLRGLLPCASPTRPRSARRLTVESLEDRLCPSYTVLDLGTLGGAGSVANAINTSGQVVGSSETNTGEERAFLWQNGSMTDLLGTESRASDINDAGQVVGSIGPVDRPGPLHAFLWQNGVLTDLGTLGGPVSQARAINSHGQVVGTSTPQVGVAHAFVWENGVMYDLNSLIPVGSGFQLEDARDINDNRIVGYGITDGQVRAFLLTDDDGVFGNGGAVLTDLGSLGGTVTVANGLNGLGQVVGSSRDSGEYEHAFRYSAGAMTDLKTLGGYTSFAEGINDSGQVVGASQYRRKDWYSPRHAFLWQSGTMTDLNKFLPRKSPWTLELANDINNAGDIVGRGTLNGQNRAFLMVADSAALHGGSVSTAPAAETLSVEQVQPLLSETLARWQAAGADTSSLSGVEVRIADLGDTTLGLAAGDTIWLDDDAAGWGWFVDPTPSDDSEFLSPGDQGEQGRIDLLSALMHEVGHLLGHDHDAGGVMADTLAAGQRPLLASEAGWADLAAALHASEGPANTPDGLHPGHRGRRRG